MSEVAQALNQTEALSFAWRLITWAFVAYLFVLGVLIFARPRMVNRFLDGFVSSEPINLFEAALRLISGLAFIAVSPEAKIPNLLFAFGAILAGSAVLMAFLYGAHKRFAGWAIPFAKRLLPAMGIVAVGFAALITWALS